MKMKNSLLFNTVLIISALLIMPNILSAQDYLIGDEDVLQLSVWGSPELSAQVPVRPDGKISAPLIGDVKASGLTPQQLKELLEKELSRFVKTPVVSVLVTSINSFKIYVIGEGAAGRTAGTAGTPSGVITLRRDTTLMQLLAQLGTLSSADLNSSYVLRDGKKLSPDFYRLIVKGDISQDIQLRPNDIIFIPDNFEKRIRIVGAVKNPGVIPYKEGLTALDAVLSAGGFTEFAKQNDVVIVRKEGNNIKNINARLKDMVKDGDITKDVDLKPGDLIIVKTGIF